MREFKVIVTGVVTRNGNVMVARKEDIEGHPLSGQYHFPGGHLENGQDPKEALKEKLSEKAGVDVNVHQIIDIVDEEDDLIRIFYNCETSDAGEPGDGIDEVEWVEPEVLKDELGENDAGNVEDREEISKFVEKLKHMPAI